MRAPQVIAVVSLIGMLLVVGVRGYATVGDPVSVTILLVLAAAFVGSTVWVGIRWWRRRPPTR